MEQIPYIVSKSSIHLLPSHQVCFEMGHHHLKANFAIHRTVNHNLSFSNRYIDFLSFRFARKGTLVSESLSTNVRPNKQPSLQGAFICMFQMVRTLSVHQDIRIAFVFKAAETHSGSFPTALLPSTTQDYQWGAILRGRRQQAI